MHTEPTSAYGCASSHCQRASCAALPRAVAAPPLPPQTWAGWEDECSKGCLIWPVAHQHIGWQSCAAWQRALSAMAEQAEMMAMLCSPSAVWQLCLVVLSLSKLGHAMTMAWDSIVPACKGLHATHRCKLLANAVHCQQPLLTVQPVDMPLDALRCLFEGTHVMVLLLSTFKMLRQLPACR